MMSASASAMMSIGGCPFSFAINSSVALGEEKSTASKLMTISSFPQSRP